MKRNACSIREAFDVNQLTQEQKDLNGWLTFILSESLPLSVVEKPSYRKQSKYCHRFSLCRMSETVRKLTQMVEKPIAREMKEAGRGTLMHDAWSKGGVHYIALYACYVRRIMKVEKGETVFEEKPELTLLSCAPISAARDVTGTHDEKARACQFNAQLHAEHFRYVLDKFYGIDLSKWAVGCIADNTSTNLKTASILGIPHVGCINHLLNLDVNDWIDGDEELADVVMSLTEVMKKAKTLKNSAKLAEFTHLKPLLNNETRWSGVRIMIDRFIRIREALLRTAHSEGTDLEVDDSHNFLSCCEKFQGHMEEVDSVTKFLQNRHLSYEESRLAVDTMCQQIMVNKNRVGSIFKDCTFEPKRVKLERHRLHPDLHFEKGVVKIQRRQEDELSEQEKAAVKHLIVNDVHENENDNNENIHNNDNGEETIMEKLHRLKTQRNLSSHQSKYGNIDFIFGSAAEVERLWSLAKHILEDDRRGMMGEDMFEALLFLKVNMRFWNEVDVAQADRNRNEMDGNEESSGDDEEASDDDDDDDDDDGLHF